MSQTIESDADIKIGQEKIILIKACNDHNLLNGRISGFPLIRLLRNQCNNPEIVTFPGIYSRIVCADMNASS